MALAEKNNMAILASKHNDAYRKLGFLENNLSNFIPFTDAEWIAGTTNLRLFLQRCGFNLDNAVSEIEGMQRFYWLDEKFSNVLRNNDFREETDQYKHWVPYVDPAVSDFYDYSAWEQQAEPSQVLDSKPFSKVLSSVEFEHYAKFNIQSDPSITVETGTVVDSMYGAGGIFQVHFTKGPRKNTEQSIHFDEIVNFADPLQVVQGSTVQVCSLPEDEYAQRGNVSTLGMKRSDNGFYIYLGMLWQKVFSESGDNLSAFLMQIANYDSTHAPWMARETLKAYFKPFDDKYQVVQKAVTDYGSAFLLDVQSERDAVVAKLRRELPAGASREDRIKKVTQHYNDLLSTSASKEINSVYRYNMASPDVRRNILVSFYNRTTDDAYRATAELLLENVYQKVWKLSGTDKIALENNNIYVFPTLTFMGGYASMVKTASPLAYYTLDDVQSYEPGFCAAFGALLQSRNNYYEAALGNHQPGREVSGDTLGAWDEELQRCFFSVTEAAYAGVDQLARVQRFNTDVELDYRVNMVPISFEDTTVYDLLVNESRYGRDTRLDRAIAKEKMVSEIPLVSGVYNERHSHSPFHLLYARQNFKGQKVGLDNVKETSKWVSYNDPYNVDAEGNPLVQWVEQATYSNPGRVHKFTMNDEVFSFTVNEPYPSVAKLVGLMQYAENQSSETLLSKGIYVQSADDLIFFLSQSAMVLVRTESDEGYRFWENLGFTTLSMAANRKRPVQHMKDYYSVESVREMSYPMDKNWGLVVEVEGYNIVLSSHDTSGKYMRFDKQREILRDQFVTDAATETALDTIVEPYTERLLDPGKSFVAEIQQQLDSKYNDLYAVPDSQRINAYTVPGSNFKIGLECEELQFVVRPYYGGADMIQSWRDFFFDSEIDDHEDYSTYHNEDLLLNYGSSNVADRNDYKIAYSIAGDFSSDILVAFNMTVNGKNLSLVVPKRWFIRKHATMSVPLADAITDSAPATTVAMVMFDSAGTISASSSMATDTWTDMCQFGTSQDGVMRFETHRGEGKEYIAESYRFPFFLKMGSKAFAQAYTGDTPKKVQIPSPTLTPAPYTFLSPGKNTISSDLELTFFKVDGEYININDTDLSSSGISITIPAGQWTPQELVDYINDMRRVIGGQGYIAQSESDYEARQNIYKVIAKLVDVTPIYGMTYDSVNQRWSANTKQTLYFEQVCENDTDTFTIGGSFCTAFGMAVATDGIYGAWSSMAAPRLDKATLTAKSYCDLLNWRAGMKSSTGYDPVKDWNQYVGTESASTYYDDSSNTDDSIRQFIEFGVIDNKWVGIRRCNRTVVFQNGLSHQVAGSGWSDMFFLFSDTDATTTFLPRKGLFYQIRDEIIAHHNASFSSTQESDTYLDPSDPDLVANQTYVPRTILDCIYLQKYTADNTTYQAIKGSPRITVRAYRALAKYGVAQMDIDRYSQEFRDSVDLDLFPMDEAAELLEDSTIRQQRIDLVAQEIATRFKWNTNTVTNAVIAQARSFFDGYNRLYNCWRHYTFRLGDGWDSASIMIDGGLADVNVTNAESSWREPPFVPYISQLLGWDIGVERNLQTLDKGMFVKSLVKLYRTKGTLDGANILFGIIGIIPEIIELYRSFPMNGDFSIPNHAGVRKDLNCLYDPKPFTKIQIPDFYRTGVGRQLLYTVLKEQGFEKAIMDALVAEGLDAQQAATKMASVYNLPSQQIDYDYLCEKVLAKAPAIRNYLQVFSDNPNYRHTGDWYLNKSNRVRMSLQLVNWQKFGEDQMDVAEMFVEFFKPAHVMLESSKLSLPAIADRPYNDMLGSSMRESFSVKAKAHMADKVNGMLPLRFDSLEVHHSRRDHLNNFDNQNRDTATKYQELRLNTCNSVVTTSEELVFDYLSDRSLKFILHDGKHYYIVDEDVENTAYFYKRLKMFLDVNDKIVVPAGQSVYIDIKRTDGSVVHLEAKDALYDAPYAISDLCATLYAKALDQGINTYWFAADDERKEMVVHSLEQFSIDSFYASSSTDYGPYLEGHIMGEPYMLKFPLVNGKYVVESQNSYIPTINYRQRVMDHWENRVTFADMPYGTMDVSDAIQYLMLRLNEETPGVQIAPRWFMDVSGSYIEFVSTDPKNLEITSVTLGYEGDISMWDSSKIFEAKWNSGYQWSHGMFADWLFYRVFRMVVEGKYPEYSAYTIEQVRAQIFSSYEIVTNSRTPLTCCRMVAPMWHMHFEMNDMFSYLDIVSYGSRPHHSFMLDNAYNSSTFRAVASLYYNNMYLYDIDPEQVTWFKSGSYTQGTCDGDVMDLGHVMRNVRPYSVDGALPNSGNYTPEDASKYITRSVAPYTRGNENWQYYRFDWIPYYSVTLHSKSPYCYMASVSGDMCDSQVVELTDLNPPVEVDATNDLLTLDVKMGDTWETDLGVRIQHGLYTTIEGLRNAIQLALDNTINRPYDLFSKECRRILAIGNYARRRTDIDNAYVKRLMMHLKDGLYLIAPGSQVVLDTNVATFTASNTSPTILAMNPYQLVDAMNAGVEYHTGHESSDMRLCCRGLSDGYFLEMASSSNIAIMTYPSLNPLTGCYMMETEFADDAIPVSAANSKKFAMVTVDGVFKVAPGSQVGFSTTLGDVYYTNSTPLIQELAPTQLFDNLMSVRPANLFLSLKSYQGYYVLYVMGSTPMTIKSFTSTSQLGTYFVADATTNLPSSIYFTYLFDRNIGLESMDTQFRIQDTGELFKILFRRYSHLVDGSWAESTDNGGNTSWHYNDTVYAVANETPNLPRFDGFVYDDRQTFTFNQRDESVKGALDVVQVPRGTRFGQNQESKEVDYIATNGEAYYEEKFFVAGLGSGKFVIPPGEIRTIAFDIFTKDGDGNFIEVGHSSHVNTKGKQITSDALPLELTLSELAGAIQYELNNHVYRTDSDGDKVVNAYATGLVFCTATDIGRENYTVNGVPKFDPVLSLVSETSFAICLKDASDAVDVARTTFCNPVSVTGNYMIWMGAKESSQWYPNGIPTFGSEVRPFGVKSWSSTDEHALSDTEYWYYNETESPKVGCRHEFLLKTVGGKVIVPPGSAVYFKYAYDTGAADAIDLAGVFQWANSTVLPAVLTAVDLVAVFNDQANWSVKTNIVASVELFDQSFDIATANAKGLLKVVLNNATTGSVRSYRYFEIIEPFANLYATNTGIILNTQTYRQDDVEYSRTGYFRKPTYWRDYYRTLEDGDSIRFDYRAFDPRFISEGYNLYTRDNSETAYTKRQSYHGRRKWHWNETDVPDKASKGGVNYGGEATGWRKIAYYPQSGFRFSYLDNVDARKIRLQDQDGRGFRVQQGYVAVVPAYDTYLRMPILGYEKAMFLPHFETVERVDIGTGRSSYDKVLSIRHGHSARLFFKLGSVDGDGNDVYSENFIEISNTSDKARHYDIDELVSEMNAHFGAADLSKTVRQRAYVRNQDGKMVEGSQPNLGAANRLRVARVRIGQVDYIGLVKRPPMFEVLAGKSSLLSSKQGSYLEYDPQGIAASDTPPELVIERGVVDDAMPSEPTIPTISNVTNNEADDNYYLKESAAVWDNVDLASRVIPTQYLRYMLDGTSRGSYPVQGQTLKIAFYPRVIANDRVFSPCYVFEHVFTQNFASVENFCSYLNGQVQLWHDAIVHTPTMTTEEQQAIATMLVPLARPVDGHIQFWCQCYYRLLPCDSLPQLGFSALDTLASQAAADDTAQELWSSLSDTDRILKYGQYALNTYVPPRSTSFYRDRPTDLFVVKDKQLLKPFNAYKLGVVSEFFQCGGVRYWESRLDDIPRSRVVVTRFAHSDVVTCQYFGV